MMEGMRILHTSDWHLGNRLMDELRLDEFCDFLKWLLKLMKQEKVEALLVSGDIFDSTTPSDKARELYCDFLSRADATGCRQIIVTAGNHDSVQMLQVATPLLRRHHTQVVANLKPEDAGSCLVPLCDATGKPQVLVAAVPFLRPHEVSLQANAEDAEARRTAYADGIAACYSRVAQAAHEWKDARPEAADVRLIAMGHLTVTGVESTDSTRMAVIGTIESVRSSIFDPMFDYVALGHIHRRRDLDGGRIRYCGSPLPMGFDEARTPGEVLLVDITESGVEVHPVTVPTFIDYREEYCTTAKELDTLIDALGKRGENAPHVRLKLHYAGTDLSIMDIRGRLDENAAACKLKNYCIMRETAPQTRTGNDNAGLPTLQELNPECVFARRLQEWQAGSTPPMDDEHARLLTEMFTQLLAEARATLDRKESAAEHSASTVSPTSPLA